MVRFFGEGGGDVLLEATTQLDSTADLAQLGEGIDLLELSVVGDEQTAAELSEDREGQVGQSTVANERDVALLGVGQVGGDEGLKEVRIEASRAVDDPQRGDVEGGDVGNSEFVGPDQVGQLDLETETNAVGGDLKSASDGLQGADEAGQALVVVDVEGADGGDVDHVDAGGESIADGDLVGLGEGTQGDGVQGGQRLEGERADLGQAGEFDAVELLEGLQRELSADLPERAAGDVVEVADVEDLEVASNLAGTREINAAIAGDDNGALELLARGDLGGFSLASDSRRRRLAAGLGYIGSVWTSSGVGARNGYLPTAEPTAARTGRIFVTIILMVYLSAPRLDPEFPNFGKGEVAE